MSTIFDTNQFICHFQALEKVDESKFSNYKDPIVVFRDPKNNKHIQVKVLPFKSSQSDLMSGKSFAEKYQYFKVKVRGLKKRDVSVESDIAADESIVVKASVDDLGTFEDFNLTFNNPTDIDINFDAFFEQYLDLSLTVLTEFNNSFKEALS